jgi:4a-hydroxytetrahydrobiopterin dehydratase
LNGVDLSKKSCIPCKGDTPPLTLEQAIEFLGEIPNWELVGADRLERSWSFDNFADALAFVNAAGVVCEQENHHADFELGWGRVYVKIWTHKIGGLTESDFILAAKIDEVC